MEEIMQNNFESKRIVSIGLVVAYAFINIIEMLPRFVQLSFLKNVYVGTNTMSNALYFLTGLMLPLSIVFTILNLVIILVLYTTIKPLIANKQLFTTLFFVYYVALIASLGITIFRQLFRLFETMLSIDTYIRIVNVVNLGGTVIFAITVIVLLVGLITIIYKEFYIGYAAIGVLYIILILLAHILPLTIHSGSIAAYINILFIVYYVDFAAVIVSIVFLMLLKKTFLKPENTPLSDEFSY
jgi:hypothetical protein